MQKTRSSLGLLVLWLLALAPVCAGEISLTVEVHGAKPATGQAILSLFDSEKSFLKEPLRELTLPIDHAGKCLFQLQNLAVGHYAVSIVYDEDRSGTLNTGFLGIPTELVGFSNNARGRFGPPSFKQTRFSLEASRAIQIRLGKAKSQDFK